jgi:hypothetical protein
VAVSTFVIGQRSGHHPLLSPFDEFDHLDYLDRTAHFHLLHSGQQVHQAAMRIQTCRGGLEGVGRTGSGVCGGVYDSHAFQWQGLSTADIHPPLYYLLTGPPARLLAATGAPRDFLEAGRLLGGVWLGGALMLLISAGRRLGARPWVLGATCLGILTAPAVIRANALVTNDASSMFVGALVLWSVVRWEGQYARERRLWAGGLPLLFFVGVFAAGTRSTHLVVVIAGCLALLLGRNGSLSDEEQRSAAARMIHRLRLTPSRVAASITLGAGALLTSLCWLTYRALTAVTPEVPNLIAQREHASSLSFGELTAAVKVFFPLLGADSPSSAPMMGPLRDLLLFVGSAALLIGLGALVLQEGRSTTPGALASGTLVASVVGGPLLVVATFLSESVYTPIPPRYGLSLLPMFVAVGAAAVKRPGPRVVWAVAFAVLGVAGLRLILDTAIV